MKRFGPFGVLLVALLVMRLVLMAVVPVFDPSEARYATLAANMARSGDFVVPHFTYKGEYQSFDGKPPLVFQAGGLCCRALGVDARRVGNRFALQFAVRVFPLLSAVLLLFIVYRAARRRRDVETAQLAVAVCATSVAFYAAAGISMTDIPLACCVAGALLLYDADSWASRFGVAALLGAGMIVKGPVALVMFGLPVLVDAALNGRWRRIFDWRWLAVAPLALLVAVPWFVAVEARNPGSVWYFFYHENFLRFVTHDYGDKYGAGREFFRGMSAIWAFVVTLPWALVPVWGRLKGRGTGGPWRAAARELLRSFPFVAAVTITAFWCLTSRVLFYYLIPVIPLFAVWLAEDGDRALLRRLVRPAAVLAVVVTLGALVGGMVFSGKMLGAAAPDAHGFHNRYSYEFYHGR